VERSTDNLKELDVQLHIHEKKGSLDSSVDAHTMIEEYKSRGFDVVGLLGHDTKVVVDRDDIVVMNGVEVTISGFHHIVHYPEHDLSILAHPGFTWGDFATSAVHHHEDFYDVDAVERYGGGKPQFEGETTLPEVGGDDSHNIVQIGRSWTKVYAPECSSEAVVEAIKNGMCEPVNKGMGAFEKGLAYLDKGLASCGSMASDRDYNVPL